MLHVEKFGEIKSWADDRLKVRQMQGPVWQESFVLGLKIRTYELLELL